MDGIPFAEEKCNTDACPEGATDAAEPVTELTMIEVCEEVETEEEAEQEEECEDDKPDDKDDEMEGSGSGEGSAITMGSGESEGVEMSAEGEPKTMGSGESEGMDMSAEGSGDVESESVLLSLLFFFFTLRLLNNECYCTVWSRTSFGRSYGAANDNGRIGSGRGSDETPTPGRRVGAINRRGFWHGIWHRIWTRLRSRLWTRLRTRLGHDPRRVGLGHRRPRPQHDGSRRGARHRKQIRTLDRRQCHSRH